MIFAALATAAMWVQPPAPYRGDWSGAVRVIADPIELDRYCRSWNVIGPSGALMTACYIPGLNLLVLPAPCPWRDAYARLVCHESAHGRGWRH